jgi:hypothetical protein
MTAEYDEQMAALHAMEMRYVKIFNLIPRLDGNAWFVGIGANLQEGIYGFGDTPYLAILAFNKAMEKKPTAPSAPHVADAMRKAVASLKAVLDNCLGNDVLSVYGSAHSNAGIRFNVSRKDFDMIMAGALRSVGAAP